MSWLLALGATLVLAAGLSARRVWGVVRPPRVTAPPRGGPPPAPFVARTGDGLCLSGWLLETEATAGLFLLCHNLGSHKGRLLPIAARLHQAGYSVALFDFRGHGESDGHRGWRTPFWRYAEDLRAVLGELRRRGVERGGGVVLAGYSLGTVACLLVGAQDREVRGLALDSGPALSVTGTFRRRFRVAFRLPSVPFRWLALPLLAVLVGERRLRADLPRALGSLGDRELLLILGERDEIVTAEDARSVLAAAGPGRREFWIVPGAHHMTNFSVDRDAYLARVLALARRALAPSEETARA